MGKNSAISVMGITYIILAVFLVYTLASFWPAIQVPTNQPDGTPTADWDPSVIWFGRSFKMATEIRLLCLVVIAAALGSYVHTVTSFVSYVGNKTFVSSWTWWYLLRPFAGVALALIFYFAIRGGLLSQGAPGSDISPFGVAAIAGLVGMFSKQASDKLEETFTNLFRTERGDNERLDKLDANAPVIEEFDPADVSAGGDDVEVKVKGKNFSESTTVWVNDEKRETEFKGKTELVVHLTSKDTGNAGRLSIVVKAAAPSTLNSGVKELEVKAPQAESGQ